MLDNLPALVAFARIVSEGNMSAAAREMELPLSVVSKRLAQLEESVGVQLLQRTARRQTLTQEGAMFYERVTRILDEVEQAEAVLLHHRQEVGGLLRVTAACAFGRQWITPLLTDFQRLHPRLEVQLELTDTVTNLIESGYDLAIRFGTLADSTLVARKIEDRQQLSGRVRLTRLPQAIWRTGPSGRLGPASLHFDG